MSARCQLNLSPLPPLRRRRGGQRAGRLFPAEAHSRETFPDRFPRSFVLRVSDFDSCMTATTDDEGAFRFLLGQLSGHQAATVEAYSTPTRTRAAPRPGRRRRRVRRALRGRTGEPAVPAEAEALARRLESLPADQTRSVGGDSPASRRPPTEEDVAAFLAPPGAPANSAGSATSAS